MAPGQPLGRSKKRTHRRDRVVRRFLYVVVGLAALVLAAPTLIGGTSLVTGMAASAVPPEVGTLTIGGSSLGWFAPVSLQRVTLADPQGRVIAHADAVEIDRTLLNLAFNRQDLGVIRVVRPALYVTVRPDGSSLEDLLARLEKPEGADEPVAGPGASTPDRYTLAIQGAALAVTDAVTGQTMIHDPIDAEVVIGQGLESLDVSGFAHAAVVEPGADLPPLPLAGPLNRRGGGFSAKLGREATGANEATFNLSGVQVASLTPLLRRVDASLAIDGSAQGRGSMSWWPTGAGPAGGPTSSTGQLRVSGFQLASNLLSGDTLRSSTIDVPWRLSTGPDGRVRVDQLAVDCDFAKATLTGDFSTDEAAALAGGDWRAARSVQLSADVDLARLARVAPRALHLQQGVTLRAGRVQLAATVRPQGAGRTIRGRLATADLVAERAGRPLRWDQPLAIELAAADSPKGFAVSRLTCNSSFLTGSASGDLSGFQATAQLDLDKLVAQTSQLFDFGSWRLAGRASAKMQLARVGAQGFRGTAEADVDGCVVTHDDRPVVLERKMRVTLGGEGQTSGASVWPTRVTAGTAAVVSDGDRLDAKLTAPISLAGAASYPLDVQLTGGLNNWVRRLQSLTPGGVLPADLETAGAVNAKLQGLFGAERVAVSSAKLKATDLQVTNPSLRINEPLIEFTGDAAWDAATGQIASRAGEFVSQTVAFRARNLQWTASGATGDLALRANLARLGAALPAALGERQLAGELTGGVQLGGVVGGVAGASASNATVDLTAKQLTITEPSPSGAPAVLWSEPTLRLRGGLAHDAAADRLAIRDLAIQSKTLSGVVAGVVNELSTAPSPALTGTADYDLEQLSPLIASYAGPGVTLRGRHQAKFEVSAVAGAKASAHWSRRWTGRLEAPWSDAVVYGLPVGQGVLKASLADGLLRTEPLRFAFGAPAQSPQSTGQQAGQGPQSPGSQPGQGLLSPGSQPGQGMVTLQPMVQFEPAPAVWGLPEGEVASNVLLTPEISQRMLKFIAPVLADATRSEGTFSLRTDGVRSPLGDPAGLATTGQLTIRNLRVTPGPGVANWVSVARTVEALAKDRDPTVLAARPAPTLLSIKERTVNFQVARGRVYHEGLQFDVDGVPVSSSGSVGFDETLQLTLSVPIQDRWIAGEQRLVGLRGQVLRLPVTGTLQSPQIDRRQLQSLSQQLIQSGLRGAVENEIGRALEKLFK